MSQLRFHILFSSQIRKDTHVISFVKKNIQLTILSSNY